MSTSDEVCTVSRLLASRLEEGPCVRAMRDEPLVVADKIRHDQRWPRYVPQAVKAGLKAQMAIQLYLEEKTLGGLNLYSTERETIDPEALHAAELFATHAALRWVGLDGSLS